MKAYGLALLMLGATMVLGACDSQGGAGLLGPAVAGSFSAEDAAVGASGRRVGNDRCRLQGQLVGVAHHLLASGKASFEKRGADLRLSVQAEDIDIALAGQMARVVVGGQVSTTLDRRVQIGCLDAACLRGAFDLNLDTRDGNLVPDFTGKTNCADAAIKVTVTDEHGAVIVTGMMTVK